MSSFSITMSYLGELLKFLCLGLLICTMKMVLTEKVKATICKTPGVYPGKPYTSKMAAYYYLYSQFFRFPDSKIESMVKEKAMQLLRILTCFKNAMVFSNYIHEKLYTVSKILLWHLKNATHFSAKQWYVWTLLFYHTFLFIKCLYLI